VTIEVSTKDCAALGDAELSEMADLAATTVGWEVGRLGKEAEEWVLVSTASQDGKLKGYMFATLERIGGTPAVVIGLAYTVRNKSSSTIMRAMMNDQYHRALMAFPDEDVLVSVRLSEPGGMEALAKLSDVRPCGASRPNGEERAWGRRLSKRYGAVSFDDRSMIARAHGDDMFVEHQPASNGAEVAPCFADCDTDAGDFVIGWGWAMAEFLEKYRAS
jgi:hypothetical protein